jgi:hypothetical protein
LHGAGLTQYRRAVELALFVRLDARDRMALASLSPLSSIIS